MKTLVDKDKVMKIIESRMNSANPGSLEHQRLVSIYREVLQLKPYTTMRIFVNYVGDNKALAEEEVTTTLENAGASVQSISLYSRDEMPKCDDWFDDYSFAFVVDIQSSKTFDELHDACRGTGIAIADHPPDITKE